MVVTLGMNQESKIFLIVDVKMDLCVLRLMLEYIFFLQCRKSHGRYSKTNPGTYFALAKMQSPECLYSPRISVNQGTFCFGFEYKSFQHLQGGASRHEVHRCYVWHIPDAFAATF